MNADNVDVSGIMAKLKSQGEPPMANFVFRIPENELKAFKAACAESGVRPSAVIRELIREFMNGQ